MDRKAEASSVREREREREREVRAWYDSMMYDVCMMSCMYDVCTVCMYVYVCGMQSAKRKERP